MSNFTDLATELTSKKLQLVSAESCTGGLFAAHATAIPGSSEWFYGSFVTYTLASKRQFLGVQEATLDHWGAVSEPCAKEMAAGALTHSAADLSVAITGVAGPDGGDAVTPIGTVWFAWAQRGESLIHTAQHRFEGDRAAVREAAAQRAAIGLLWMLQ